MKKCETCHHEVHAGCNYNQGRCPHRVALVTIPTWRKLLYLAISPFIIVAFMISNPKKFLKEAKKEWSSK